MKVDPHPPNLFLLYFERHCSSLFLRNSSEEESTDYYSLLGVNRDASCKTIQFAYTAGVASSTELMTEEELARFELAHEVLTNPVRRRRFNNVGEAGLALLENPLKILTNTGGPAVLIRNFHNNTDDRSIVICFMLLAFTLCLLQPALLSGASDGDSIFLMHSSLAALWSPMWLVDVALLANAIIAFFHDWSDEWLEDDAEPAGLGSPTESNSDVTCEAWYDLHKYQLVQLVQVLLFIVGQVAIIAELDGMDLNLTNWFVVLTPWYLWEIVNAGSLLRPAASEHLFPVNFVKDDIVEEGTGKGGDAAGSEDVKVDVDEEAPAQRAVLQPKEVLDGVVSAEEVVEKAAWQVAVKEGDKLTPECEFMIYEYYRLMQEKKDAQVGIFNSIIRFWLAFFIAAKMQNYNDHSWYWAFAPIWLWLVVRNCYACMCYGSEGVRTAEGVDFGALYAGNASGTDQMAKGRYSVGMFGQCAIIFLCQGVPLYFFLCFSAALEGEQGPKIDLGLAFLPFWIFMSITFVCCSCCCIIALMSSPEEIEASIVEKVSQAQVKAAGIATSAATGAMSGQMESLVKDFEDFKPEDLTEDDIIKIQKGDFSHLSKSLSPTQQIIVGQFVAQQQRAGAFPMAPPSDFDGDDTASLLR